MKQEFQDMAANLELIMKKGSNRQGNEILVYISNINFETCYIYYELDENQFYSHIRLYAIDHLTSQNPVIANLHEKWIESLKRFSTLITRSGEIERIEFFSEQKEMINELLS